MSLALHLSIHVLSALFAGYIVWRFWREPLISFGAAFLGAVLIDLDHFIDYFFAFGWKFNLDAFVQGHQFLKSDKIYVLFHGWEYIILLGVVAWILHERKRLQGAVLALSLGALFHLLVDVNINHGMTLKAYSIIYRANNQFDIKKIVTEEHYQNHILKKQTANVK